MATADLDATLAAAGVDGLYVGPGDLSLSLGCAPDPDDPVLNGALQRIWVACAAAGKPVGVHATDGAVALAKVNIDENEAITAPRPSEASIRVISSGFWISCSNSRPW